MSEARQRLIGEFDKNSMEKVKIHLQEFHGRTYCDLRIWIAEKAGQTGAECATRKGITLSAELLPDLIKALGEAQRVLENGPGVEIVADEAK